MMQIRIVYCMYRLLINTSTNGMFEAVDALRKQGLSIVLDLVGPAYSPALQRLNTSIDRFDAVRNWVHYHGEIPYTELHAMYSDVDMGIRHRLAKPLG